MHMLSDAKTRMSGGAGELASDWGGARSGGLGAAGGCRVTRLQRVVGLPMGRTVRARRVGGAGSRPGGRSPAQAHAATGRSGIVVGPRSASAGLGVRGRHRHALDGPTAGRGGAGAVRRPFQPPVSQRLARPPRDQSATAAAHPARTGRSDDRPLGRIRLAGDKKGAAAARATLVFPDETGLLMAPLLRTTLAPRGCTPRIEQRASHRDKVSVAAALWKAPGPAGRVRIAFRTYPDQFVNN